MPGHFHFICDSLQKDKVTFGEAEARHISGVLRYTIGDEISFTNGKGTSGKASITGISKKSVEAQVLSQKLNERSKSLTLAIGILRQSDRMEWLVEKCTEFGVEKIIFISSDNAQKSKVNLDRMNKKAFAAVKQSHGSFLPSIETQKFSDAIALKENKFIAYCTDGTNKLQVVDLPSQANVFIGPEGDFSEREIKLAEEMGAKPLELGTNVLRAETAAILTCGVHYL